jgi:hypothetical protein
MTNRKNKTPSAPADSPSGRLEVQCEPGQSKAASLATTALRPTVQAGITATKLLGPYFIEPDLGELVNSLLGHVKAAAQGDLSRTEAMLVSQAQTLDLLFNKLTRQAVQNIGHYPETVSIYMKLALRAQSQCRAVAETLHEMKHPRPVAFFQQANIANGPQQVNNGSAPPPQGSRAGENQISHNELSGEIGNANQLDRSATQSTKQGDTRMAPLGEIHGTAVTSGKTHIES